MDRRHLLIFFLLVITLLYSTFEEEEEQQQEVVADRVWTRRIGRRRRQISVDGDLVVASSSADDAYWSGANASCGPMYFAHNARAAYEPEYRVFDAYVVPTEVASGDDELVAYVVAEPRRVEGGRLLALFDDDATESAAPCVVHAASGVVGCRVPPAVARRALDQWHARRRRRAPTPDARRRRALCVACDGAFSAAAVLRLTLYGGATSDCASLAAASATACGARRVSPPVPVCGPGGVVADGADDARFSVFAQRPLPPFDALYAADELRAPVTGDAAQRFAKSFEASQRDVRAGAAHSVVLAACVLVSNRHALRMTEYVSYHTYLGVDRVFVVDTTPLNQTSLVRRLAQPYVDDGAVTLMQWPAAAASGETAPLHACFRVAAQRYRWTLVSAVDELLHFSHSFLSVVRTSDGRVQAAQRRLFEMQRVARRAALLLESTPSLLALLLRYATVEGTPGELVITHSGGNDSAGRAAELDIAALGMCEHTCAPCFESAKDAVEDARDDDDDDDDKVNDGSDHARLFFYADTTAACCTIHGSVDRRRVMARRDAVLHVERGRVALFDARRFQQPILCAGDAAIERHALGAVTFNHSIREERDGDFRRLDDSMALARAMAHVDVVSKRSRVESIFLQLAEAEQE